MYYKNLLHTSMHSVNNCCISKSLNLSFQQWPILKKPRPFSKKLYKDGREVRPSIWPFGRQVPPLTSRVRALTHGLQQFYHVPIDVLPSAKLKWVHELPLTCSSSWEGHQAPAPVGGPPGSWCFACAAGLDRPHYSGNATDINKENRL